MENSRPGQKRLCNSILAGKVCRFGKDCKFSHDVPGSTHESTRPNSSPRSTASDATRSPAQARPEPSLAHPRVASTPAQLKLEADLRTWTNLLPRTKSLSTYEARERDTRRFFEVGWDLVATGNPAAAQHVITKLATESGLRMIKAVTDNLENVVSDSAVVTTFRQMTVPLFRIVSYTNARSSLILETPLNAIHNYLYGPDGRRLLCVFRSTATALGNLLADRSDDHEEQYQEELTITLLVLQAICQLRQNAQLLQDLPPIVDTLAACVPPDILYHEARQLLAKIQRRLHLGDMLPNASIKTAVQQTIRPKFKFQRDLPGDLSEEGSRHNNDHANIIDIRILPTAEEIQSSRQEYLPSNDPNEESLAWTRRPARSTVSPSSRRLNRAPS